VKLIVQAQAHRKTETQSWHYIRKVVSANGDRTPGLTHAKTKNPLHTDLPPFTEINSHDLKPNYRTKYYKISGRQ
jgi:hypothetical protein